MPLRNACAGGLGAVAMLFAIALVQPVAAAPRHVHAAPGAADAQDPMTPVFVVTSLSTFQDGLGAHARPLAHARASSGERLVLVELRAHQLEELGRHVHVEEHRCGGYFAFSSRAQAEAFLREDRGARALATRFIPTYSIDNERAVTRWMAQVDEPRIRAGIAHLSTAYPNRHFASTSGREAAIWIRDHWASLARGRDDVSVELFTDCDNCATQPSVILTIQGNELADEIVVLGGHLDSISNSTSGGVMNAPGADDDASGIATLSEVLRVAMKHRYRPRRTVKFMAYAAEEVGLRGSRAIAQQFAQEERDVVGVLQMDMTNYKAAGATSDVRVMTDNSNAAQVQFMRELFARYLAPQGYTLGTSSCGYACSDHASWHQAGFPAGMYDEGPFFPLLHTPNDTLANLGGTAAHATLIAKLGLAFLGEMGKATAVRDRFVPPQPEPPSGGGRLRSRTP